MRRCIRLITEIRLEVCGVAFKRDGKKKQEADYTALNHSGQSNLFEIRYYLGFATRAPSALTTYLIFERRQLKAASRNSPLIRLPACLIIVPAKGACDILAENIPG